jgi:hypothetical protein
VIETRHQLHVRDLVLSSAVDRIATGRAVTTSTLVGPSRPNDTAAAADTAEASDLTDAIDPVDVIAVAAALVHGQLGAATAPLRSSEARYMLATEVFATGQSFAADTRAAGAFGVVVGEIGEGGVATAAAIAHALAVFTAEEMIDAAIAMCAASLLLLSRTSGVSLRDIVAWSAGDDPAAAPVKARTTVRRVAGCRARTRTRRALRTH